MAKLYRTELGKAVQGCGERAGQAVPAGEGPEYRLGMLVGDGLVAVPTQLIRRGVRVRGEPGEEHTSADGRFGFVQVGDRRGERCG